MQLLSVAILLATIMVQFGINCTATNSDQQHIAVHQAPYNMKRTSECLGRTLQLSLL